MPVEIRLFQSDFADLRSIYIGVSRAHAPRAFELPSSSVAVAVGVPRSPNATDDAWAARKGASIDAAANERTECVESERRCGKYIENRSIEIANTIRMGGRTPSIHVRVIVPWSTSIPNSKESGTHAQRPQLGRYWLVRHGDRRLDRELGGKRT